MHFGSKTKDVTIKEAKAKLESLQQKLSQVKMKEAEAELQEMSQSMVGELGAGGDTMNRLDEQLNDMRAEKYASSTAQPVEVKNAEEESETDPEEQGEDDITEGIPADNSSVSAEINDLFDSAQSVGKSVEKVNNTLEQMSERIRNFPPQGE